MKVALIGELNVATAFPRSSAPLRSYRSRASLDITEYSDNRSLVGIDSGSFLGEMRQIPLVRNIKRSIISGIIENELYQLTGRKNVGVFHIIECPS